MAEKEKKR